MTTCDCGCQKITVNGFDMCQHCDTADCANAAPLPRCPLCPKYKAGVARRLSTK